jgi:hypothetical protein
MTAVTPGQAAYEAGPLGWIGKGAWPPVPFGQLSPEDRAWWGKVAAGANGALHAEAGRLRDQLARRDALLAEILGTYAPTGSGHASKVGQVRLIGWKRDAGMGLTERERRIAGA